MARGEGNRGKGQSEHVDSRTREMQRAQDQHGLAVGTNPVKGLRISLFSIIAARESQEKPPVVERQDG